MREQKTIRVLQIAPSLGVHGGIEGVAISILSQCLRAGTVDAKLLFRIRTGREPSDDFHDLIRPFRQRVFQFRRNPFILFRLILRADIVHCHYPFVWAFLPAVLLGKKTIITIHNKKPPGRIMVRGMEKLAIRLADRSVFNSNFVASTWGFTPGSDERVPAIAERTKLSVPFGERRGFVVVARLIPEKGVAVLVEAYQKAGIDHAAMPLVIVGAGPERERLQEMALRRHGEHISFVGHRHGNEKTALVAASRWNVAPAIYQEDQGMTPIEAAICGIPSIVSRIGGLPESAGPGAITVPPGDIGSLTRALETAAIMQPAEYEKRCSLNEEYFEQYLPSPSHYSSEYALLMS